jgi:anti-sigma-K factor RskA
MSDLHALSGAYAVDALDDLERARFERHLDVCEDCRTEVASLREAATLIAEETALAPPPALRDRVLAEIATVRPLPPRPADVPAPAPAPTRRRRWVALTAAAAVVAVLGVGAAVWEPWRDDTSQGPTAAELVINAPDAASETLTFPTGARAKLVRSASMHKALLVTSAMPAAPQGKVYQLWYAVPGQGMVSAGLMPAKADQTVLLDGDAAEATAAGITVEPAGGSPQPTSDPIALFSFDQLRPVA